MGIFKGLKKMFSRKPVENQSVITDEMRQKALETRRLNSKIDQLEKQLEANKRLEILQQAVAGNGKDTSDNKMEEMLLTMLMSSFMKPSQSLNPPSQLLGGRNITPSNNPINLEKNSQIAEFVSSKIPDAIIPQLADLTDGDLADIREKVLRIKAGG